ncbi:restriction endonuclease subunit S [Azonexus sp.]|uniref:restriction endonuclease subunit S n=1 Tax=Azonexus sp. TaxID=1872668 RepID=UPI0035B44295
MGERDLPSGWAHATVGDLADYINGRAFKPEEWKTSGKPIVRIQNLNDPTAKFNFSPVEHEEKYLLKNGDLLFAWSASLGAHIWNGGEAWLNQHIFNVVPRDCTTQKFLFYLLKKITADLYAKAHGSGMVHVTKGKFESTEVAFPPLAEQHRIVAKIEELFSELDQGVASLKTAREQLKVYRQSLLKNAFEGKLTAAWRAAHADQLETAAALQQRIARERQARYQQQLADWQTTGQPGPKPKPPKPLPPLTTEELAELPELPAGWGWVRFGQLFNVFVGSTPSRKRNDFWGGEIPWVSSGEVAFCRIRGTKEKISAEGFANASTELHPPGTVMLAMIGEGKTRGQAAILDVAAAHNQNTAAIRVSEAGCSAEFVYQYLVYQYEITRKIGSGNNQKALNKERVSELLLPLCGLDEMAEVVSKIDEKLSEADQLDQTLATALQQADALRQSILKKAFCGQLVAQDKNDESATALLERIRAAKSGQSKGKPRRIAPDQPEILELKASPGQVIPFPVPLPGIAAKDLQAGIVAMAYRLHESHPEKLEHFGHVKAEKICHLVEAHLGLDLERQPLKEAAGPNDHPHLKRVEHRARLANWFEVTRLDSGKYVFHPKPGFSRLLDKTRRVLGARLGEVERLLELMLPMTMRQAEILATVYAAWNNLLLLGKSPNDEEIVTEARENWHESKLKIERDKFFTALAWMRGKGLVPSGRGRFVKAKGEV